MKTKVKPKAKASASTEAIVDTKAETKASAKVAACITAQTNAQVNLVSKKRATCEAIRTEAVRLGIADDKKAIRQMVLASWVLAFNMTNESEAIQKRFVERSQPDVSKIMMLAYPSNDKASKELAAAFAFNDSLATDTPKAERLGEGKLIDIARGSMTLKQALAAKEQKKASRNLDSVITPYERFKNGFAQLVATAKVGGKDRISEADAKKAVNEVFVDWFKPSTK